MALAVLGAAVAGALALRSRDEGARADATAAPRVVLDDVREGRPPVVVGGAGRPQVVNFFASWCKPCEAELPTLAAAAGRHGDRVAFVGVDERDSRTSAAAMLDAAGVGYPAAYDPEGALTVPYRLRGLPTTVFVAADGRVVDTVTGPLDEARLEAYLERLVGPAR